MAGELLYELLFKSLFTEGRGFSFPCDAQGRVDLDALSHREKTDYLFARALVGRDLSVPVVNPLTRWCGLTVQLDTKVAGPPQQRDRATRPTMETEG